MKKRICAVIMCLLLAVNLVGVPKAKAVATETALLGSIFGSLLVSLGYSWAAENMDVPTFGESIYKLIQEHDDAYKDTGVQLLRDLNIAGLTSTGAGKIAFPYQWVQAARSFAEWFQSKFFIDDNTSAVVYPGGVSSITTVDGYVINLTQIESFDSTDNFHDVHPVNLGSNIFETFGIDYSTIGSGSQRVNLTDSVWLEFYNESNYSKMTWHIADGGRNTEWATHYNYVKDGFAYPVFLAFPDGKLGWAYYFTSDFSVPNFKNIVEYKPSWTIAPDILSLSDLGLVESFSLTAEKLQEVHYPEVAEDGSQVYEITVDGVTATDIEGIIQGAVDQILAGTAAIAGDVTQAQDVPVDPEAPAAGEYAVPGLETIFPFCIPFDIYAFCAALNADPVAPSFEWRMQYAPLDLDYTFVIDLEAFDGAARVLRTMELLAFCVGLAFWTRHLIRG